MKRITEKKRVVDMVAASPYRSLLEELNIPLFLAVYEAGEFISAPWGQQTLFQIVCQGELSIYYVRDDGSRYSLAQGARHTASEKWRCLNRMTQPFLRRRRRAVSDFLSSRK